MSRILLVDDDEHFRKMLHEMLERAGHEVRDAANGRIALKLEEEQPSELVVIDLVMPEKEGLETISDLRRRRPDVKIIAMSGGGRADPKTNLTVAGLMGAQRTLTKPFSRSEVLLAIEEVLGSSKS